MKSIRISQVLALFLSASFIAVSASAAVVAVIDSGVDPKHKELVAHAWLNAGEIAGNAQDDDGNGYVDDIQGWNFAESNNQVIDYKYLGTFSQDPYKYFELQLKSFEGTITEEEKAWMSAKRQDKNFIAEMGKFGNFVHGTHVAGIAARDQADAKIMGLKIIPTEVKLPGQGLFTTIAAADPGMFDPIIRMGLDYLAKQQSTMLIQVGKYTHAAGARVANCSFGSAYDNLKPVVEQLLAIIPGYEPTEEDVHNYTVYLLNSLLKQQEAFVGAAPQTLFVIAAGNSGMDNDAIPAAPANLNKANTITVAATYKHEKLASFSNFGSKTVDIAAPGVGIYSAIPGTEYLRVSGTSQAAPFVANAANGVVDANPNLTPAQVKKILMGTVDHKEFLVGKVSSSGIANLARSRRAAELSLSMSIDAAIATARMQVEDYVSSASVWGMQSVDGGIFLPMPTGFAF